MAVAQAARADARGALAGDSEAFARLAGAPQEIARFAQVGRRERGAAAASS